jgi:type III secretion protein J
MNGIGMKTAIPLAAALLLAGCERAELYTGLTEKEANEMLAVVHGAGFDAAKATPDNGKTWTLSATKGDFPQEVALLEARGYPRERYETLGDVFKKEGFVSSPTEERARMMFGLSQELSHTISEIDGVVDARVHVAMPEDDPLDDQPKPSSAAVFIKYDPSVELGDQVGSIKALVVNSIEGLPYDKVTVVLSPARPISPAVTARSGARPGLALLSGVAALGGAAGFAAWRRKRPADRALVPEKEPAA